MLRSSPALPPYAVEVPITGKLDASRTPTLEIDAAFGPSKFDFNAATRVGCSLNSNIQNPIPLSASQDGSKALVWELDSEKPRVLSLRHFSVDVGNAAEEEEDAVHLIFSAPILPSISSCAIEDGSKIFCLTADGALHIITHVKRSTTDPTAIGGDGANEHLARSSSSSFDSEAIQSVSFASAFERLGTPTALVYVQGTVCIGTTLGHILCISAEQPSMESTFELDANAGLLNGLISGFFNRGKPQDVEQLVELRFMNTSFLCSLHAGGVLRLWDLTSKKMVHSCDLIPPEEAAVHKATLARVAVEPLDATCSILLIFFEPIDPSSSAPGMLCTFELFLEDRGGSIKVLMEGGPRLAGGVFRLVDLGVQHIGVHSIGAWMLYDDQNGRRKMHCVPLAFTDGEVKTSVEVLLMEEQIEASVPMGATEQQIELLSRLATTLESSMPSTDRFSATDVFQDQIFAPGHLCRPVLHRTVEDLQWSDVLSFEDIMRSDIVSLRFLFTQAVNTAAEQHVKGRLGVWIDVFASYTIALRSYFAPRALVKLSVHRDEEQGLLLVRSGGSLSVVRAARPQEIVAANAWPPIWGKMRSADSNGVKSIVQAAEVLVDACGGRHALMMIQGCLLHGAHLRMQVFPAVLRWLLGSNNDVPLKLGTLCSAPSNGFASAIEAFVTLLANECVPPVDNTRSPLEIFPGPVRAACMARAHQTAAAQCECLLGVALLAAYVTSQHTLGTWTVPEQDRQLILGSVSDRMDWMLAAAGVAYWSTAAPVAHSEEKNRSQRGISTASETANMVISLKIGDDDAGGSSGGRGGAGAGILSPSGARKRARLTPNTSSSSIFAYPAELLLSSFQSHAHAVRDVCDLQGVAETFSSWLLCIPRVTDIDLRRKNTPLEDIALTRALEVAPVLTQTRSAAALTQLMAMIKNIASDDPRVLFFSACSKALMLSSSTTTSTRNSNTNSKLEMESMALFFSVAAAYSHRSYLQAKLPGVRAALDSVLSSFTSTTPTANNRTIEVPEDASETQIAAADELYYYESLITIFEKLGCPHAASRFAMAATQHVPDAFPGENMTEERVLRTGRLWHSVFNFCLQAGGYEEAYAALLGNELADIQVDCVHQLVNAMVERGEIAALVALPFARTSLVVRNAQPVWVSLLDEAVAALKKRAALSELDSRPQPYHVLFDFHVARGNFQAAASAMVSYARRLAAEAPENRQAVEEAQKALAAAVGALGLVDSEQAWLEDPSGALKPMSSPTKYARFGATEEDENQEKSELLWVPKILAMADLKIEHAIAVAKSSVAAVLPGGDVGTKTANEVFHQLLALKLHQEAFALADTAFVGTKQQRMREKAMFSLATVCAELQLQTGIGAKNNDSYYTTAGSDEGMLTDDAAAENYDLVGAGGAADDGERTTTATTTLSAASASWKRLRTYLETYEKQGSEAGGMNLRVLAVDAVLATNSSLQPPLWLLAPFFPPPSEGPLSAKMPNADVAGLLRAYLKHGRVEDAAILAVKVLSRVADGVPSVSLPRPAAVYLPHTLLEELARRVPSTSPVKNDLTEKLNKAQAAAARQTQVLENIYTATA